jgi:hypothetical protein
MKKSILLVSALLAVFMYTSRLSAAEWRFPIGLVYATGFQDVYNLHKDNVTAQGFNVDDEFYWPVGLSFQPYVLFQNGLGIGAGIGSFTYIHTSDDLNGYNFYDIPINLNIRYTPLPKLNISPYIRVGGSYHIAWGDFVKKSKPGFLGALGVEFLRNRKVSFGVEAVYDSAEITFDKYDNLGGTLFSKGEKNIKPGNFIFGLYIIF